MEDKKDIGKAFKEKLSGLQKSPGDAVWQSLNADLDKRRKRKLTSFWFRFLGIAFVMLITASIITFNIWEDKKTPPTIQTTGVGNIASPHNNNEGTTSGTPSTINDNTIINNDTNDNSNQGNSSNNTITNLNSTDRKGYVNNDSKNNHNPGNDNRRAGTSSNADTPSIREVKKTESNNGDNPIKTNTKKSGYAKNSGSGKNTNNSNPTTIYNKRYAKAGVIKKSSTAQGNAGDDNQNNTDSQKTDSRKKAGRASVQNTIAQEKATGSRLLSESDQQTSDSNFKNMTDSKADNSRKSTSAQSENNTTRTDNTTITTIDKGTDIVTKIIGDTGQLTANDTVIKQADSLRTEKPVAEEEKNPDEKKKTDSIHPPDFKRWYFAVNAGPSKYNFPSNKSIIDSRLDSNAVDIKNTFNYGAYIGYRFTTKWGVRLGLNIAKIEQVTKNAYLLNEEQQAEDFEYINYASAAQVPDPSPNPGEPPVFTQGNEAIIEELGPYADITVKITYIEIPAEVTFHALGNRIGADITAGLSTLLINKNTVYASNDFGSVYMGSLDGKKMSFSTNLGLRFYYQFIPALQLNVEPAFRYYLNTFDNVKPYSLHLQAGIQYNFNISKKKE